MSDLLKQEKFVTVNDLKGDKCLTCYDFGSAGIGCAQQNHRAFEVFYNFIKEVQPVRILEIGTGLGGLTMFLYETCKSLNLKTSIRSYDTNRFGEHMLFKDTDIDMRYENVFVNVDEPNPQEILQRFTPKVINKDLIDFARQDGVTIVLCDGLHKVEEFNLLAPHIKPGDFMLAHDYCENHEIFKSTINQKVWNWCEIELRNIQIAMDNNNITEYKKEVFNNVAWICTMKHEFYRNPLITNNET